MAGLVDAAAVAGMRGLAVSVGSDAPPPLPLPSPPASPASPASPPPPPPPGNGSGSSGGRTDGTSALGRAGVGAGIAGALLLMVALLACVAWCRRTSGRPALPRKVVQMQQLPLAFKDRRPRPALRAPALPTRARPAPVDVQPGSFEKSSESLLKQLQR